MPFLELFDETLDINSTENYELCLQVSDDNLTFAILDSIRNKFILIRSFTPDNSRKFIGEQIKETVSKDDFLTKKYRKVHLLLPTPKFTLVPSALFDPGKKDEYFIFNHVVTESTTILNNKITDPDSFLLFAVHKPILELIQSFYPSAIPFHHLSPLFHHISHARKTAVENYIHAHIESDFFNMLVFDNNTLQFSNSFTYRNISDILYYILNVLKNLGLKQEETINLSGQVERYDDLFSNLSLYIRNVKFSEPSGNFTFSYVFNDTSLHKYINLFTIAGCE
jgi:hypothetical protein